MKQLKLVTFRLGPLPNSADLILAKVEAPECFEESIHELVNNQRVLL